MTVNIKIFPPFIYFYILCFFISQIPSDEPSLAKQTAMDFKFLIFNLFSHFHIYIHTTVYIYVHSFLAGALQREVLCGGRS